jgi:hypothetical protein
LLGKDSSHQNIIQDERLGRGKTRWWARRSEAKVSKLLKDVETPPCLKKRIDELVLSLNLAHYHIMSES